jgi:tetratricopeptide (TPR) repeat protein
MGANRLEKLLDFIKNEPNDPFLKYALATEYLRLNDTEKALVYYEDLVKNNPAYTGTYYHLGKLYEALGRRAEALATFETGMKVTQEQRDNHAFSEIRAVYDELMED